jgi:hypothetical protein
MLNFLKRADVLAILQAPYSSFSLARKDCPIQSRTKLIDPQSDNLLEVVLGHRFENFNVSEACISRVGSYMRTD